MTLGEKIRTARLARGMTQSQLAGDDFTRNMLCQIERGAATPSLPTLSVIAKRLDIPEGYFLSEDTSPLGYIKLAHMGEIYAELEKRHFGECARLIKKHFVDEYDDEIALIRARCCLENGKACFESGALESASKHFSDAQAWCERTRLPTNDIRACCTLLRAISDNVQSPKLEFDDKTYQSYLEDAVGLESYNYLYEVTDYSYSSPLYGEHIKARDMMRHGRYEEALSVMLILDERKSQEKINAFFLFRLYSDIENCYRETYNYEKAYLYSTKRISLLSAFKT